MDPEFHFEELAFLARIDPEAFERRRRMIIGAYLSQAGRHRARGEQLQREIEAERRQAGSPEAAMMLIARRMGRQLNLLGEELDKLHAELNRLPMAAAPETISAR